VPPIDRSPIASAELLAIGAELLVGETRDTNSGDLARALTDLGVEVRRMTQLPDELDTIAEAVAAALGRVDLVVTSGGLGPTPDDLTREGIAAALAEQPAVDPGLEAWLRDLWAKRGLPFSSVNLKQAWLIPSASALDNPNGTAPGWWVETGSRVILALPGPPRELLPMWQDQALPRLRARGLGIDRAAVTLRLTGIGESAVVDLVGADVLASRNPQLATYARPDSVDLRVSATGDGTRSAAALVEEALASLSPRLDTYVFARDEEDWAVAIAGRLGTRRVATVEVGTGGYLALLLGSAPFLVHAAVHGAMALRGPAGLDPVALARQARADSGTEIGLAVVAHESGDDMRAAVGLDIEGHESRASHVIFRGGEIGRRRSANAGAAELWRRLGAGAPD
jgi:nicotinamide-nucleotide amidase